MGLTIHLTSKAVEKHGIYFVLKKPGLNGFVRVGAVVFTQCVFGQGGLVM